MYYNNLTIDQKINAKSWYRAVRYYGNRLLDEMLLDLHLLPINTSNKYVKQPYNYA